MVSIAALIGIWFENSLVNASLFLRHSRLALKPFVETSTSNPALAQANRTCKCPLSGVKRTSQIHAAMSAFDRWSQPVDATLALNLPHAGLLGNKGKMTAY
jgi:hypothetical protein